MTASAGLVRQLRAVGVAAGDLVMVHASMRRVGGRAEALVAALDQAVGRRGTWMMVYSATADPAGFDAHSTPADPDVGVLAEVMRRAPGTVVSNHPEARFGARGPLAAALTADVPWHHYFGPGSPLERLAGCGGSVLRLGADTNTVTLFHHAEYLARLPHKRAVTRFPLVRQTDGTARRRRVDCLDDSDGIAPWPAGDYFHDLTRAVHRAGLMTTGQVGGATAECFAAAAGLAVAARWMERHLVTSVFPQDRPEGTG